MWSHELLNYFGLFVLLVSVSSLGTFYLSCVSFDSSLYYWFLKVYRHRDLLETLIVPALRSGAEDLQKLLQSHRMELKQKLERIVVVRNNKIAAPSLEVTANANLLRELDDDALSGIFSVTSTLSTLSMSTYTSSLASCKGAFDSVGRTFAEPADYMS